VNGDRAAWTRAIAGDALGDVIRANKYHARKCTVDGIRFDSTREAKRYQELRLYERAGMIRDLELQPEFPILVVELWRLDARTIRVGRYRADFRYVDATTDDVVVEDAKSDATKTTAYRLRKRLVEAIHGITIREV